jgi:hypothetical protein
MKKINEKIKRTKEIIGKRAQRVTIKAAERGLAVSKTIHT